MIIRNKAGKIFHSLVLLLQARTKVSLTTPRIDEMLTKFRQRTCSEALAPVAQPQPQPQSSQAIHSAVAETVDSVNEERIKKLEEQVYQLIKKVLI